MAPEKSRPLRNLPSVLWLEILSRLPVKSLLRFRCVSKWWWSIIGDHHFFLLHLNNFKNNRRVTNLFVVQKQDGTEKENCVLRNTDTFQTTAMLGNIDPSRLGCELRVVYSMDGLVLMEFYNKGRKTNKLMLWNPSIRRAQTLPPSPVEFSNEMNVIDVGFGFSPLIKDYKLLRLHYFHGNECFVDCRAILVYTFETGSWKPIQFQSKGRTKWCWYHDSEYERRTISFRGVLYFISYNLVDDVKDLVSFDLSTEVFASINLPYDYGNLMPNLWPQHNPLLVDGGGSLGIFTFTGSLGSIWVLESCGTNVESSHWTKRYTFDSKIREIDPSEGSWPTFLYIKKNGDMILQWCERVTSYNLETRKEKTLLKNEGGLLMDTVCGYKESLFLLNGDPTG